MTDPRAHKLTAALTAQRLRVLGSVPKDGGSLVLIGPQEPAFWPHFTSSPEYRDAFPDPMDRWSKRVLTAIASDFDATPFFPSDGPPFHPFYTWALETEQIWASPIGLLVHDDAGLFVSFRGALHVPWDMPANPATAPCAICPQPCATACPVGAFAGGYDVARCKAHIATPEGRECLQGCLARRACPVGRGNRLPAQSAFHMEAFL